MVRSYFHHNSKAIFCVDWSALDPRRLASSGADNVCIVFEASSEPKVLFRLRHKDAVYGCAWNPSVDGVLITGTDGWTDGPG
jgi:WD40 repeat protein